LSITTAGHVIRDKMPNASAHLVQYRFKICEGSPEDVATTLPMASC